MPKARSSALPKLIMGAAVLTASCATQAQDVVKGSGNPKSDGDAISKNFGVHFHKPYLQKVISSESKATIVVPIREEWSEAKHGPELKRLIVSKAVKGFLAAPDQIRLSNLQSMRSEALPLAMSYEAFIRDRDSKEELQRLVTMLENYKSKYCA